MSSQKCVPAGKALNISKALAWMSVPSIAAGLWGACDYSDMSRNLADLADFLKLAFTVVDATTRQNVTVVDTQNNREMHLRSTQTLITPDALLQLQQDLEKYLSEQSCVVFAGSFPQGDPLDRCLELIQWTKGRCRELVVDTSGIGLAQIVEHGIADTIKPNLDELSELLGDQVDNDIQGIITKARKLCHKIKTVIVSLGADGAVLVRQGMAIHCRAVHLEKPIVSTVACGDYLLGGYLSVDPTLDLTTALSAGIRSATAKALGWSETKSWQQIKQDIQVETTHY